MLDYLTIRSKRSLVVGNVRVCIVDRFSYVVPTKVGSSINFQQGQFFLTSPKNIDLTFTKTPNYTCIWLYMYDFNF
jgi:hypothetical protein